MRFFEIEMAVVKNTDPIWKCGFPTVLRATVGAETVLEARRRALEYAWLNDRRVLMINGILITGG
jgi:hypothetical protein